MKKEIPGTLKITRDGTTVTCRLHGSISLANQREIMDFLREDLATANYFIIDLEEVKYFDSSAIGLMMAIRKKLEHRAVPLQLINVSEYAERILRLTCVDRLFSGISPCILKEKTMAARFLENGL